MYRRASTRRDVMRKRSQNDGGMYQWDTAAPAAVARAAGLHVSRIDGSPMVYNAPDPWLPDLVVCRPELADAVLDATAQR